MDAVETIMRKNGYAQLSARKIADVAGLNYQLVFYYFEKIEDLFLETYRRRTGRLLKLYKRALKSPRPLHGLWALSNNRTDGVLSIEYMAMSNHYESIKTESVKHVRNIIEEMKKSLPVNIYYSDNGGVSVNPVTLAFLIGSIGNYTTFQKSQGISEPELDVSELITLLLKHIEPEVSD